MTVNGRERSFFRHYHRTLQKLWLCSVSCKMWSNKIDYSYLLERQIKAICIVLIILQCMHTYTELTHNSVSPLIWISYRRKIAEENNAIYRCGDIRLPDPSLNRYVFWGSHRPRLQQSSHQLRVAIHI